MTVHKLITLFNIPHCCSSWSDSTVNITVCYRTLYVGMTRKTYTLASSPEKDKFQFKDTE